MAAALSPFSQGVAVGSRADALPRGENRWRVFLYPQEGPRSFDVAGATPAEATRNAWAALKAQREESARRGA